MLAGEDKADKLYQIVVLQRAKEAFKVGVGEICESNE